MWVRAGGAWSLRITSSSQSLGKEQDHGYRCDNQVPRLEASLPPGLRGGVFDTKEYSDFIEGFSIYFGDHIDWNALYEFSLAKLYDVKNIKLESHIIADDIKTDIEYHSKPPIEEFRYERLFLAPLDVKNEWNKAITRGSAYALVASDQVNIFLNSGNLTTEYSWEEGNICIMYRL